MNRSTLTGIASAVIALSALLFSVYSFQEQQSRAERHAVASAKPILKIRSQNYLNKKSIKLTNAGIGPAIIKSAKFSKNGKSTNNIVELFDLGIRWETFINVPKKTPIQAKEELVLVFVTQGHLMKQGFSDKKSLELLAKWENQKTGISVEIIYEDIYGNPQDRLSMTLK